jgi:hypothetical protein
MYKVRPSYLDFLAAILQSFHGFLDGFLVSLCWLRRQR